MFACVSGGCTRCRRHPDAASAIKHDVVPATQSKAIRELWVSGSWGTLPPNDKKALVGGSATVHCSTKGENR